MTIYLGYKNLEKDEIDNMSIEDNFPEKYLMVIMDEEPWYANIANYLASNYLPKGLTHQQKKKLFSEIKY